MAEAKEEERMLPNSAAFRANLALLHVASVSKLTALSDVILDALSRPGSGAVSLSDTERRAVLKAFKVEDPTPVIDLLVFLFQQFGYYAAKAAQVSVALTEAGMDETSAGAISASWEENSRPFLTRLRTSPLQGVNALTDVAIQPQIGNFPGFAPTCVVQLSGSSSDVTLQLTNEQLYSFFQSLDDMQAKVDLLTNA